jgi:hypothetical protein
MSAIRRSETAGRYLATSAFSTDFPETVVLDARRHEGLALQLGDL